MTNEKQLAGTQGDPRGVFYDLFDADKAAEMTIRAEALMGMREWLAQSGLTQVAAAKLLGLTQARVSDLKRGKINVFSLDMLIRLAARAGLQPKLKFMAKFRRAA